MKATGDVASAAGGGYRERKEAPRSKVVGAPSRSQLLGTARGKVRRIKARVIITQNRLKPYKYWVCGRFLKKNF